jgi:hypothetical protein
MMKENKRIIFNGNNYSDEWQKDAAKRGLLNLKNSVDAYPELMKPDVVKAFEKYAVLSEREMRARYDVALEQYNKTINIEAQLMVLMGNRYILPAAYRYQGELAQSVAAVKAAGAASKETRAALDTLCSLVDQCKSRVDHLQDLLEHEGADDAEKLHGRLDIPVQCRHRPRNYDSLEGIVPHDCGPRPPIERCRRRLEASSRQGWDSGGPRGAGRPFFMGVRTCRGRTCRWFPRWRPRSGGPLARRRPAPRRADRADESRRSADADAVADRRGCRILRRRFRRSVLDGPPPADRRDFL